MKYHITSVSSKPSVRKDGSAVLTKSGKQMFSVGIKTAELGDVWLSGLMPFNPDRWEGTEQEIEVYDEEYNGKTYKKFKLPPRENTASSGAQNLTLQHILHTVKMTQEDVSNIRKFIMEGKKIPQELSGRDYPTAEQEGINPAKAGMKSEDDSFEELATPEGW